MDEAVVRALLREQRPEWAELPLVRAGAGTDNTMYRLGDELLVRLPRTAGNARAVRKEQEWLPRLAPHLSFAVPEPVHSGRPSEAFPVAWSVYRWIEGVEPGPGTVSDWAAFGSDLAAAVRELHGTGLMGAVRADGLDWYRGGSLQPCDEWVGKSFADCRALGAAGLDLDVDAVAGLWRAGLALPGPAGPQGWLHGDLKPTNLLVRDGRLAAVIDFGGLSVGFPDAEHAAVWDLPAAAREAYWTAVGIDEATWVRARAWAVGVAVSGLAYYWHTYPAFVAECRARLDAVLADAAVR